MYSWGYMTCTCHITPSDSMCCAGNSHTFFVFGRQSYTTSWLALGDMLVLSWHAWPINPCCCGNYLYPCFVNLCLVKLLSLRVIGWLMEQILESLEGIQSQIEVEIAASKSPMRALFRRLITSFVSGVLFESGYIISQCFIQTLFHADKTSRCVLTLKDNHTGVQ